MWDLGMMVVTITTGTLLVMKVLFVDIKVELLLVMRVVVVMVVIE